MLYMYALYGQLLYMLMLYIVLLYVLMHCYCIDTTNATCFGTLYNTHVHWFYYR
jgi:hypothetical protein